MSAFLHGPALWYATRATGLVTMLLLTATVLLGVLTTGRFAGNSNWPRFLTVGLHRNLSLLVLVFLALHVGTTVVDQFVSIPLAALSRRPRCRSRGRADGLCASRREAVA